MRTRRRGWRPLTTPLCPRWPRSNLEPSLASASPDIRKTRRWAGCRQWNPGLGASVQHPVRQAGQWAGPRLESVTLGCGRKSPSAGPPRASRERTNHSQGGARRGENTHPPPNSPPGRSQSTRVSGPQPRRPSPHLLALRSGPHPLRTPLGLGARPSSPPRPARVPGSSSSSRNSSSGGGAQGGKSFATRTPRGWAPMAGLPSGQRFRADRAGGVGRKADRAELDGREPAGQWRRQTRLAGLQALPAQSERDQGAACGAPAAPAPPPIAGAAPPAAVGFPSLCGAERCASVRQQGCAGPLVRCVGRSHPSLCGRCSPRTAPRRANPCRYWQTTGKNRGRISVSGFLGGCESLLSPGLGTTGLDGRSPACLKGSNTSLR